MKANGASPEVTKEISPTIGAIRVFISTTGTVLPKNRLEVKPPVNGRIESILVQEGEKVKAKQPLLEVSGRLVSLFSAERVALNLLQHLSGIATLTRSYVRELRGLSTVLLDTRKTNPGLRVLEKYAVRTGGGRNHRFGLDDGILIKTNHIRAAGGVAEAVRRARQLAPHHLKIEVEVSNFRELEAAVGAGAELVLLDNMKLTEIKKSVDRFGDRVEFEISGGVTRENIRRLAQTGVNFISSGAIIHSARWVNIARALRRPATISAGSLSAWS